MQRSAARWCVVGVVLAVMTYVFAIGEDGWKRPVASLNADAAYYYAYVPSLVLDRDLDLKDEYRVTGNWYRLEPTPLRRPGNVFGIGPAIFEMPAFLVGHGLALLAGARADGFSRWHVVPSLWLSIPFTLGALLLAYRLARRRLGPGWHAYLGPALALVNGPMLYYAIRQPGYAHAFATFFATWLVERWDASYDSDRPRSLRTWLVLGVAAGCAVLARPQLATWVVLLLPAAVVDDFRRRGAQPMPPLVARWAAAAAIAFLCGLPQFVAWKLLYGSWYVVPQGEGFMRWDAPAWSETLFSSRNGLFPWAPLYVPMLIGCLALVRRLPRLVVALVLGLVAQALINGAAWDWWAGGSFGGRRFDSTYVVFALGAAAGLRAAAAWIANGPLRRAVVAVALAVVALVTVAVVDLAMRTSVTSARIGGGEPASAIWKRLGGLRGRAAAWLSRASNAPARAYFALRYDVPFDAYDRIVGVHYLGETYPGLNSYPDRLTDTIVVTRDNPRHEGLRPVDGSRAAIDRRARLLVGLNRRGGVSLRFNVDAKTASTVRVGWNDTTLVDRQLPAGNTRLELDAPSIERGTNVLELTSSAPITISNIELRASPPPH